MLYNTLHSKSFFFFYHFIKILFLYYFLILFYSYASSSLFLCSVFSQTKTSYCNTTSHHQKIQATTTSIKKSNPPSLPLENPIHHPPLENLSHHPPSTNINRNLAIHQPPLQTPTQNQTNNHHKIPSFKPKPKSTNNQVLAIAKEIFFFF